MAQKMFFNACALLIFLVLAGGVAVEGLRACQEYLGECGRRHPSECQEKCQLKHLGVDVEGSCDNSVGTPLCVCLFDCPPPICIGDVGICDSDCDQNCCRAKCGSTYGGLVVQSFCSQTGSPDKLFHCQCQFVCGSPPEEMKH